MIDGLLLGVSLILLSELPDALEFPETLVSVDKLRECNRLGSADTTASTILRLNGLEIGLRLNGLEIGGKPFLNAISRAEEADVCCDIDSGDFFGS